ncbi:MAG: TraR/DksA C4-type zinc finger protein [Candidatus Nealsonbacteria bacterium]|nr:TraR/DksA C4-type zinc finger protein [Candidatus Nealsonbacteria bacterium]
MNKIFTKQIKEILEKEKETIEKQLQSFANKDTNLRGDWDTRFPRFSEETGGSSMERAADEVEEYGRLLPIEFSLEKKLQDINSALEKIKKGKYGICENCKKSISIERLKAFPSAKSCEKCK